MGVMNYNLIPEKEIIIVWESCIFSRFKPRPLREVLFFFAESPVCIYRPYNSTNSLIYYCRSHDSPLGCREPWFACDFCYERVITTKSFDRRRPFYHQMAPLVQHPQNNESNVELWWMVLSKINCCNWGMLVVNHRVWLIIYVAFKHAT